MMRIGFICGILLIASLACADVVTLKDGTRVQGNMQKTDDGYDIVGPAGDTTHVSADSIRSIELGGSTASGGALPSASSPADRLASLKRSVEQVDDLNQIITRYQQFIEQTKTTAPDVAASAQTELAMWQGRADQKMVKVGSQWMTPDQQQQALAQAAETAKQAYELMSQNKIDAADPVIQHVLSIDPQNPVALYLQGLLLYQKNETVQARKSFEMVNQQIHGDAATLNNLGVIASRQNQVINSLNFYYDAMVAMPANKEILNNVAEALAAVPQNLQKQFVVQKVQRLFAQQEAALEATMAQYGWYRWGSVWVDRAQLDQLKGAEADIKSKIDLMSKEYDGLTKKISDNNQAIANDQANMQDIVNRSTFYDQNGNPISTSYPNVYYTMAAEVSRLQVENKNAQTRQQQLHDEAEHTQASMPKPKFNGIQQLIGAEGTPLIGRAAAATQPASTTQPTGAASVPNPPPVAPTPAAAVPATPSRAPATPPPAAPVTPSPVIPAKPEAPATNRVF